MKVILLAATQDEARAHAADAGLKPFSRDVIAPGGVALLQGLRLREEDLIMEFPGFRDRLDAPAILESLKACLRTAEGAGPIWRKAGEKVPA